MGLEVVWLTHLATGNAGHMKSCRWCCSPENQPITRKRSGVVTASLSLTHKGAVAMIKGTGITGSLFMVE